jgi:hypothetical protein
VPARYPPTSPTLCRFSSLTVRIGRRSSERGWAMGSATSAPVNRARRNSALKAVDSRPYQGGRRRSACQPRRDGSRLFKVMVHWRQRSHNRRATSHDCAQALNVNVVSVSVSVPVAINRSVFLITGMSGSHRCGGVAVGGPVSRARRDEHARLPYAQAGDYLTFQGRLARFATCLTNSRSTSSSRRRGWVSSSAKWVGPSALRRRFERGRSRRRHR